MNKTQMSINIFCISLVIDPFIALLFWHVLARQYIGFYLYISGDGGGWSSSTEEVVRGITHGNCCV